MEMPLPKEHDTKTIHMPLEGASIGLIFFLSLRTVVQTAQRNLQASVAPVER
jgi:hypothetical protein